MLPARNLQNWPVFHGVIQEIKVARFLLRHGVVLYQLALYSLIT